MAGEYKGKKLFMHLPAVGSADIFALRVGVLYGIEVKRPGGKQSDAQNEFQTQLEAAGGRYIVAFNIDGVERSLSL
jgi:hypothetical protein